MLFLLLLFVFAVVVWGDGITHNIYSITPILISSSSSSISSSTLRDNESNRIRRRRNLGIISNNGTINRHLYLSPSQPSIPHFVNASFIIFCNIKQRVLETTTTATTISTNSSSSPASSVEPTQLSLLNTVQTDLETKWRDPNGVIRDNTKGRVHVEKKGGKHFIKQWIRIFQQSQYLLVLKYLNYIYRRNTKKYRHLNRLISLVSVMPNNIFIVQNNSLYFNFYSLFCKTHILTKHMENTSKNTQFCLWNCLSKTGKWT